MTHARTVVTTSSADSQQLPDWATAFAVMVEGLGGRWLDEVAERLKVRRKGGYTGLDGWLFLLLYFTAKLDGGFKGMAEASKRWSEQLGALAGRRRLITQQSLSRLNGKFQPEHVDAGFMEWLLVEAAGLTPLLQEPATWSYDTCGERCRFFDFDGKLLVLRQRGLPDYVDLPAPERQVDGSFAAAGYSGRKRGEVQMCRETLQDAGSGAWLGAWLAPGSGKANVSVPEAAQLVANVMRRLDAATDRGILRFDGFYGSWPVIKACREVGVGYLVRWRQYDLLAARNIAVQIQRGRWERVADSGSGPTRFALDLGYLNVPGTTDRARVVVSRFVDKTGRGVGVSSGGYRYELFVTSLDPRGWPAAEVVTQYFARVGQENRFCQENNELRLDRIFSKHLPAQALATLVGLFVWNFQSVAGLRLPGNNLPDLPKPSRRTVEVQPQLQPEQVHHHDANPLVDLLEANIDWAEVLPPGYQWRPGHGMECPAGHSMHHKQNRGNAFVLRVPEGVCRLCALRSSCTKSTQPRYRREFWLATTPSLIADITALKRKGFKAVTPQPGRPADPHNDRKDWTSPVGAESGPFTPSGPFLVPSELRRDARRICTAVSVKVDAFCPPRPPLPRLVAPHPARRQRRRHTWAEKLAWNALPPSAKVNIEFVAFDNRAAQLLSAFSHQRSAPTSEVAA